MFGYIYYVELNSIFAIVLKYEFSTWNIVKNLSGTRDIAMDECDSLDGHGSGQWILKECARVGRKERTAAWQETAQRQGQDRYHQLTFLKRQFKLTINTNMYNYPKTKTPHIS